MVSSSGHGQVGGTRRRTESCRPSFLDKRMLVDECLNVQILKRQPRVPGSRYHQTRRGVVVSCQGENSGGDSIEARIKAARRYKKEQNGAPDATSATFSSYAEHVTASDTETFLEAQQRVTQEQSVDGIDVTIERGFGEEWTRKNVEKEESGRKTPGGKGSSEEAATWLQTTSTQGKGIDTSLRAEEFTLEKEKRIRQQNVVIERAKGVVTGTNRKVTQVDDYGIAQQIQDAELSIAKDKQVEREKRVKQEEHRKNSDTLHKPKVATWGVFPRPQNISKTYGGGRNIRPGQELETEEEAAERKKRIDQALNQYRKIAGLDVDPVVEERATKLYEQGQVLFDNGSIRHALEKFSEAADMVPLKSKIGGLVNLQKAVCLDSLGRNEEAYSIYTSLRGHSAPGVAKNSKRMLFGFQAAKDLKVDTMRYNAGSVDQWRGYFDRATDGTWTVYKQSEDDAQEDEQEERTLALIATAVMLVPLIFVGILAISK
jgi:tetratricopeptide (TPR) repeat protein